MDLRTFLGMGGYAFYVWTAYGLALAVLIANLVLARRRSRHVAMTVKRMLKPQGGTR